MDTHRHHRHHISEPKINFLREKQPQTHHLEEQQYTFIRESVNEKQSPLKIKLNQHVNQHLDMQNSRQLHIHSLQRPVTHVTSHPIRFHNNSHLSHFHESKPISHEIRHSPTIRLSNGSYIEQQVVMEPHVEKRIVMKPHIEQKVVMHPRIQSRVVQPYFAERSTFRVQPHREIKMIHSQNHYPMKNEQIITSHQIHKQQSYQQREVNAQRQDYKINNQQFQQRPYFQKRIARNSKKQVGEQIDPPSGRSNCAYIILATCCLIVLIGLLVGLLFAFLSQSGPSPVGPVNDKHNSTVTIVGGGLGNETTSSNVNTSVQQHSNGTLIVTNQQNQSNTNVVANVTTVTSNDDIRNLRVQSQTAFMYRPQTEATVTVVSNENQTGNTTLVQTGQDYSETVTRYPRTTFMYKENTTQPNSTFMYQGNVTVQSDNSSDPSNVIIANRTCKSNSGLVLNNTDTQQQANSTFLAINNANTQRAVTTVSSSDSSYQYNPNSQAYMTYTTNSGETTDSSSSGSNYSSSSSTDSSYQNNYSMHKDKKIKTNPQKQVSSHYITITNVQPDNTS